MKHFFFILAFLAFGTFLHSPAVSADLSGSAAQRAFGAEIRFMAFNIWGDYFGNPVEERDEAAAAIIERYQPDIVGLQEVTKNWWSSRLFTSLSDQYAVLAGDSDGKNNFTPLLYRKDRLTLLAQGWDLFHVKLDKSKGVTWAVFQDKKTGRRFAAFSTHYWWKSNPESNGIRIDNSNQILARVKEIHTQWKCPVIGGGDFNCTVGSDPMKRLEEHGFVSAQEIAKDASPECSHHGNPIRGADGKYHGTPRPKNNSKTFSIDHLVVEKARVNVLLERVILDQDALDTSDHSPIFADVSFISENE